MFKKNMDFFDRVQWSHLTMVPKASTKGLLSYVYEKNFCPKINQDRVTNNVFDLQNDFHEDFEFPGLWRKNKFGS
jgi:hypothetical protein